MPLVSYSMVPGNICANVCEAGHPSHFRRTRHWPEWHARNHHFSVFIVSCMLRRVNAVGKHFRNFLSLRFSDRRFCSNKADFSVFLAEFSMRTNDWSYPFIMMNLMTDGQANFTVLCDAFEHAFVVGQKVL